MRTADLQTGNCIADPNRLIAGQSHPRAAPGADQYAAAANRDAGSRAHTAGDDRTESARGHKSHWLSDCTNIRWDVDNYQTGLL